MDSLLKDNEKCIVWVFCDKTVSPSWTLGSNFHMFILQQEHSWDLQFLESKGHTDLWGFGLKSWSLSYLYLQVLYIMFKYFLFAFSLLFKRKYMVWETFNQINVGPCAQIILLICLFCFLCASVVQQSGIRAHTHSHSWFCSHIGHYRVLSRGPKSYRLSLVYRRVCMYQS